MKKNSNKAVVATAAVSTAAEVISTPVAVSKAAKAAEIFQAAYSEQPVPKRSAILELVVAAADLTPKGAATYLQNFKRKAGLIGQGATA
jgi:hypothetical protein